MSFNGSGTFVVNTAGQPVVPNTVISATAFNALTADLANGLSTCITKDGQTTPTANIPMGNNKITGLAAGTAGTDAANLSQVQGSTAKLLQSVTGTDTITAAMVPALTAYAAGQMFYFVAAGDNTGAVTINIDSLGAKSVTRDGSTALVAGDITNGKVVVIVYDGTRFQLLNSNAFTNLYVSGNLGVGTASPQHRLDVAYDANAISAARVSNSNLGASATATLRLETQGATWTINNGRNGGFLSFSDGVERARFDNAGNLGIGTSSPIAKLDVNGNINVSPAASKIAYLTTDVATIAGVSVANYGMTVNCAFTGFTNPGTILSGYDGVLFATTGVERMRISSAGDVGIGTASPAQKLDVKGIVSFQATNSTNYWAVYTNTDNSYRINYNGAGDDEVVIDTSGNFGIGKTNPSYRLDVNRASYGVTAAFRSTDGTNNPRFVIYGDANGTTLQHTFSSTASALIFANGGSEGAGTERMRITNAGNIVAGASVALATTATDGFLYVPTCAGTPTGTPTAITGMAPIVVNTTNNKLYFYSGGAWRDAGP